jgi:hypothetical protein
MIGQLLAGNAERIAMGKRIIPPSKRWIAQWFRAKAVTTGGVIRRSVADVRHYASDKDLLTEVKRRRFHLIRCGGQYIVLCNSGRLKLLR